MRARRKCTPSEQSPPAAFCAIRSAASPPQPEWNPPRFPPSSAPTSCLGNPPGIPTRSEEHTSELQSHSDLVCRLLLEKKKKSSRPEQRDSLHVQHERC